MNTRIFLVRHGSTPLTAEDRFAGATDVPLSDDTSHYNKAGLAIPAAPSSRLSKWWDAR